MKTMYLEKKIYKKKLNSLKIILHVQRVVFVFAHKYNIYCILSCVQFTFFFKKGEIIIMCSSV